MTSLLETALAAMFCFKHFSGGKMHGYPVDESDSDNDSYYGDYDHCYDENDWDYHVGDAEWEVSREAHDWEAHRVKEAEKKIMESEMEEALECVKLMFERFESL